jgi:hypothetical protein
VSDDFLTRARLVALRVDELYDESKAAIATGDLERARAIRDEMRLCNQSLREIRRDQLMAEMEPPKPKRGFWAGLRRGLRRA